MKKLVKGVFGILSFSVVVVALLLMSSGQTKADDGYASNTGKTEVIKRDWSKPIGSTENPFTILEIVPTKEMALAGYLIPGCEPIDMSKVDTGSIWGVLANNLVNSDDLGLYRQENVTSYKLTHNDSLIRELFGESSDTIKSQVIVWEADHDLKADENAGWIVQQADLIVVLDDYMQGLDVYNAVNRNANVQAKNFTGKDNKEQNDLSWELVEEIMKKMASDRPAGLWISHNLCPNEAKGATCNAEKLFMLLFQYEHEISYKILTDSKMKVVTNDRGYATGAYDETVNWKSGTLPSNVEGATKIVTDFSKNNKDRTYSNHFAFTVTTSGSNAHYKNFVRTGLDFGEVDPGQNGSEGGLNNKELREFYGNQSQLGLLQVLVYSLQNANKEPETGLKEKLHILELQNCNTFVYGQQEEVKDRYGTVTQVGWEEYYKALIPWFKGDLEKDLVVDTMSVYQFNGDIRDINSEYDMIIIGDKQDGTNGLHGYNDTKNLVWDGKGRLYTAVGDKILRPGNNVANSDGKTVAGMEYARYTANDITRKKRAELLSFVKAGKPVVVADGLYMEKEGAIIPSRNRLDKSSQMYKFLGETFNAGTSFRYTDAKGHANDTLKNMLAYEDCAIDLKSGPVEYKCDYKDITVGGTTYKGVVDKEYYNNEFDENGKPVLSYRFVLDGTEPDGQNPKNGPFYTVELYLDRNGDGVYQGSLKEKEELAAFEVSAQSLEERVTEFKVYSIVTDSDGVEKRSAIENGALVAGAEYEVVCTLAETERGILPWKLEVAQKGNNSVRSSEIGYTAVDPKDSKEEIYVLQMDLNNIMDDKSFPSWGGGKCNAKFSWKNPIVFDETSEKWVYSQNDASNYFSTGALTTSKKFEQYLGAVKDFDVKVDFMMNSSWKAVFGEGGWYWSKAPVSEITGETERNQARKQYCINAWIDFLEDVDMLVLGFRDGALFTSDEIYYAGFSNFIQQGKSVILSHDMVRSEDLISALQGETNAAASLKTWGRYDGELRTLSGQRQKQYVENETHIDIAGSNGEYYKENMKYYVYSYGYTYNHDVTMAVADGAYTRKDPYSPVMQTSTTTTQSGQAYYTTVYVPTNIPVEEGAKVNIKNGLIADPKGSGYYLSLDAEIRDNGVQASGMGAKYYSAYVPAGAKLSTYLKENPYLLLLNREAYAGDLGPAYAMKAAWGVTDKRHVSKARKANDGQITNYPYTLSNLSGSGSGENVLSIARTHAQYFALDLEQCAGGDVTVWYNLHEASANGIYSSRPMDTASDFYIYTKGNITYTGLGHSNEALTDDEVKLFVNTMISAYRPVVEKPYAKVTNSDAVGNANAHAYAMYQIETGMESEDTRLRVDLVVTDGNMTGDRAYSLQFVDSFGRTLKEQPVLYTDKKAENTQYDEEKKCYRVLPKNDSFEVVKNQKYWVEISAYKDIYGTTGTEGAGEVALYMKATSVGIDGFERSGISSLDIYGMPLFNLN